MRVAVSGSSPIPYPQPHGLEHSPLALYQFAGNLQDSSGNGRHLTLGAGTARYGYIAPGLKGFAFDASTWLVYDTIDTALHIIDDITIEAILRTGLSNGVGYVIATMTKESADDIGPTQNFLWDFSAVDAVSGIVRHTRPFYFAEYGMGVNIEYTDLTTTMHSAKAIHLAMVRQSQQVTFYADGRQLGATSGTLTTPEKGPSGNLQKLFIAGSGAGGLISGKFMMSSLKVIGSALTAQQVQDEYERTLGTSFRI